MESMTLVRDYYRYRDYPTGDVVDISVRYYAGGSYGKKGIYVHITPLLVENVPNSTNLQTETYRAFGGKVFIRALPRKNTRALTEVAMLLDNRVSEIATMFRENRDEAFAMIQRWSY